MHWGINEILQVLADGHSAFDKTTTGFFYTQLKTQSEACQSEKCTLVKRRGAFLISIT